MFDYSNIRFPFEYSNTIFEFEYSHFYLSVLSALPKIAVGFCPVGFCPVGFCPSGVLSQWGFVRSPLIA